MFLSSKYEVTLLTKILVRGAARPATKEKQFVRTSKDAAPKTGRVLLREANSMNFGTLG